jgi:signal transduction histidine kinase
MEGIGKSLFGALRYGRSWLILLAAAFILASVLYSRYLADMLAAGERQKIEQWVGAQRFIAGAGPEQDILFATLVVSGQSEIPVIETDERDHITNHLNLDESRIRQDSSYLSDRLDAFRRIHPPIITYLDSAGERFNKYYFGESMLVTQVRYFPLVQLIVATIFLVFVFRSQRARHRAAQDRLWAGLAKETAHQLGTPISALEGWLEMMRINPADPSLPGEMEQDIGRLKRVSDRFSKIGSPPRLESSDIIPLIRQVVEYIRQRASSRVLFQIDTHGLTGCRVALSPPLFEWVIENLLRNALDAMDGQGEVRISVHKQNDQLIVDLKDTGKGMTGAVQASIFQPGFTTKKRGWGLGLPLARRIVEQYHGGILMVYNSEPGKGTTFRIILRLMD